MLVQEYASQGDLFNKITPEVGMDHAEARRHIRGVVWRVTWLGVYV